MFDLLGEGNLTKITQVSEGSKFIQELIKASGTIDDAFNQRNATKDNKVNLNILE